MKQTIKDLLAKESQCFQYLEWLESQIDESRNMINKCMYSGPAGPFCVDPGAEDRARNLVLHADDLRRLLCDRAEKRRKLVKLSERRKAAEQVERNSA